MELLSSSKRTLSTGSVLYDYEYELNSTRGRKRIINSVSINNSKLYILNGQVKCGKEVCLDDELEVVSVLRNVAKSFVVE